MLTVARWQSFVWFKQKTAYEMRISDWRSDVFSSDLPRRRLLADPGHVDGLLCRRHPLSVADRRHLPQLLRLVLRPAAELAPDLRRADRRAGERRLVQRDVPADLGLQRAPDAHPRRPFLDRKSTRLNSSH